MLERQFFFLDLDVSAGEEDHLSGDPAVGVAAMLRQALEGDDLRTAGPRMAAGARIAAPGSFPAVYSQSIDFVARP